VRKKIKLELSIQDLYQNVLIKEETQQSLDLENFDQQKQIGKLKSYILMYLKEYVIKKLCFGRVVESIHQGGEASTENFHISTYKTFLVFSLHN
jgi:hypothetical protein